MRNAIVALSVTLTGTAQAQGGFYIRYFIGESTDFTGNGCENTNLNTVTSTLRSELNNAGWFGDRWTNADAWPQDFVESCSATFGAGGIDASAADGANLAVYAGHGNRGLLQWGFQNNGRCTVLFSSNMRLGSMSGGNVANAMYITSCTLNTDSIATHANSQWTRQQYGFHNSPAVPDGSAGTFFEFTLHNTNKSQWLSSMEDKPGWFTGDNSPIVITHGTDQADCNNTHNNAKLRAGIMREPRGGGPSCGGGQPAFWYCYTLRNNGAGGC